MGMVKIRFNSRHPSRINLTACKPKPEQDKPQRNEPRPISWSRNVPFIDREISDLEQYVKTEEGKKKACEEIRQEKAFHFLLKPNRAKRGSKNWDCSFANSVKSSPLR